MYQKHSTLAYTLATLSAGMLHYACVGTQNHCLEAHDLDTASAQVCVVAPTSQDTLDHTPMSGLLLGGMQNAQADRKNVD
ncbi:MAG: hypothetical protein AAFQ08_02940, partial [Bacteroidota bacterium]